MPGNIDARHPSINDNQEVVWAQYDFGTNMMSVYSSKRGALTTAPIDFMSADPSINNAGDVVWVQMDPGPNFTQVYELVHGTTTPVRVTTEMVHHFSPAISNTGEIVWEQGQDMVSTSDRSISSSTGQLGLCPPGSKGEPSINSCGDLTFTSYGEGGAKIAYRQRSSIPCVTDREPNDSYGEASLISGNTTTTGTVAALTPTTGISSRQIRRGDRHTCELGPDNGPQRSAG